ncbi:MAG: hypothetical protein JNM88_00250 [Chitinophagaceae bacterium]|nr:hypothetical protein [Chitinophagaceae bacterium]
MANWDDNVKQFFVKIMNSVALGLLWLMACVTAGLYYELGYSAGKPVIYTILFYIIAVATLVLLIRYLIKTWKNG